MNESKQTHKAMILSCAVSTHRYTGLSTAGGLYRTDASVKAGAPLALLVLELRLAKAGQVPPADERVKESCVCLRGGARDSKCPRGNGSAAAELEREQIIAQIVHHHPRSTS